MRICAECGVKSYDTVEEYKKDHGYGPGGTPVGWPGQGGETVHSASCSVVGGAPWQLAAAEGDRRERERLKAEKMRLEAGYLRGQAIATMFSGKFTFVKVMENDDDVIVSLKSCGACGSLVYFGDREKHYDFHSNLQNDLRSATLGFPGASYFA